MSEVLKVEMVYVMRLLAAALCGGLVGYERESKKKNAGIRTHVIIAVASSAMMIISKYGFDDVLGQFVRLDPARISAGVVTAVGFIGSGIIIFRNNNINGVTTSAGIWATVGVGMAMGCGMYLLGVMTTVIVMLSEVFLGRKGFLTKKVRNEREIEISFMITDEGEEIDDVVTAIQHSGCHVESMQMRVHDSTCHLFVLVSEGKNFNASELILQLKKKIPLIEISI